MEETVKQSGNGANITPDPQKKKKFILIGTIVAVVILAVAIFLIVQHQQQVEAQRQSIINSGVFHPGITINGVSVGGLTPEEAKNAVAETEQAMLDAVSCCLTFEDIKISLSADDFGMTFNTDAILQEAMALGREGSLSELQDELEDISVNGRAFDTEYFPSAETLEKTVANVAKQVNRDPVDANFELLVVKDSENQQAEVAATPEATATPTPTPVPTPTDEKNDVQGEAPPVQASAEGRHFRYVEDQDGVVVNEAVLLQSLTDMAAEKTFSDVEIPVEYTPASVTLEQLQGQLVLRSSAYTSFAKSPYNRKSRVFNIVKAAGLINGTILQPGEEFSTNGVLGDRTYAGGWQPAPAIVQGRSEDQAGGGVCQVSTTLYLAVLKGDLEVVYRQGHSGRLGYAPGGLDATIDSGRIDFKWKNNTDAPLYVFSWADEVEKKIYVEIYGKPLEYDEIKLSSERVGSISPPGPMQYQTDYSLAPGATKVWVARKSGSIWKSYATYIKDGKEVETKEIAESRYKAYAGITLVGPSVNGIIAVPAS